MEKPGLCEARPSFSRGQGYSGPYIPKTLAPVVHESPAPKEKLTSGLWSRSHIPGWEIRGLGTSCLTSMTVHFLGCWIRGCVTQPPRFPSAWIENEYSCFGMWGSFISKVKALLSLCVHAKSLQSCLTLCIPIDCTTRLLHPWDSPGENTGVGCHGFQHGIFLM